MEQTNLAAIGTNRSRCRRSILSLVNEIQFNWFRVHAWLPRRTSSLSHCLLVDPVGLLKITEEEFSGPPLNVILELILDYMLCMYAGLAVLGNFQSILSDSEEKQAEDL
ncbi:hypothetical protein Dimus_023081 [Dionaea muscipula]